MFNYKLHNFSKIQIYLRKFSINSCQQAKNNSINKQVKIISKLYGERNSGSKKRWYPTDNNYGTTNTTIQFGKSVKTNSTSGGGGKNNTRRMQVLNKLFMEHISSLLATGEASEHILGKNLQITGVKISTDYALINVYWLGNGSAQNDGDLEKELQRCSGILRHELSQLELMGVVPRIKFVRDKSNFNLMHVETLLQNLDLTNDQEEADNFKRDFFGDANQANKMNTILQEMRHDVFGLDHKDIMLRIVGKMRKSKQAWDIHNQPITMVKKENVLPKQEELQIQTEQFKDFLNKRRTYKNVPERKKALTEDFLSQPDYNDYDHEVLSTKQKQIYEEEDYIHDEYEKTKS